MGLSLDGARQVARIKTTFKCRSCSIAARAVVVQYRIERNFGIVLQIAGGKRGIEVVGDDASFRACSRAAG